MTYIEVGITSVSLRDTGAPMMRKIEEDGWRVDRVRGLMQYVVVIEKSDNGYSAYVPDLPGCIAAASSKRETERLIREAIQLHLEAMRNEDETIPEPTSSTVLVEA